MAEGIDETISINLIDTRLLVEEARKIREAKKLADEADSVKKRLAQRPLTSSASPIASPSESESLPRGFFGGSQQTRAGAVTGGRTNNAFVEAEKKQKELESKIKKLEQEQKEFVNSFKKIGSTLSGASSITKLTPVALAGRLAMIGGPVGIIIGAVVSTILVVVDEIMKQYERGGFFSTKLKRPQQVLTLNDIEDDNAYRAGTKYITHDLRVVQKSPTDSNTANIKYEMIRYTIENRGNR